MISSITGQLGIPTLELTPHMPRNLDPAAPRLFTDSYHPNARGYGVIAAKVLDLFQEAGWVKTP